MGQIYKNVNKYFTILLYILGILLGTGWNPGEYAYILKEYLDREGTWEKECNDWLAHGEVELERGEEYASNIFNALFDDHTPYPFNANLRNHGYITNIDEGACVEVSVPGGTQTAEALEVTSSRDFEATLSVFRAAFQSGGAASALEHIVAVVIQPGVEFSNDSVSEYDSAAAAELCRSLATHPGLVFEGHSTDYQTRPCLAAMARDGIAIQKVGPALTFALREGLFALSMMERELLPEAARASFMETLDAAMVRSPGHWENYYRGTPAEQALQRRYGQSDRCRYYLAEPDVRKAVERLMENLRQTGLPLPLINQYLPVQYWKIRARALRPDPVALAVDKVGGVIDDYLAAYDLPVHGV